MNIPIEIIEAAYKVEKWMDQNGGGDWELMGIRRRSTNSDARRVCEENLGQEVIVTWNDPNADWSNFQIEGIDRTGAWLRGVTDDDGNSHDGVVFFANFYEIKQVLPRNQK